MAPTFCHVTLVPAVPEGAMTGGSSGDTAATKVKTAVVELDGRAEAESKGYACCSIVAVMIRS
jgi:hypothetical protein